MSNNPSRSGGRWRRWLGYAAAAVLLLVAGGVAGVLLVNRIEARDVVRPNVAEAAAPQLWTCGMHPQVIQDRPGKCPICHMEMTPLKTGATASAAPGGERKIKYWWDPMIGPSSISDRPGKSAMGMDLVPVYEDEAAVADGASAVVIDPVVVQNMGVRTVEVGHGPLMTTVRAVGFLRPAEPNLYDVNLRLSGWVQTLHADTEGMALDKGEPLFDLYSPQLQTAVEELIAARRSAAATREGSEADDLAAQTTSVVYDAARRKLLLLGLDEPQVDALAGLESAPPIVTFTSPIAGTLLEKSIVAGAAVREGERVLRIADLSTLWLDVKVFAQDLPFIRMEQRVVASVEGLPGRSFEGEVVFIDPSVDAMSRTATVRIELPNPDQALRPGMYATVQVEARLGEETLLVPREAVIDTGTRQVAFVSLGGGRFAPRELKLGASNRDGVVQVLEGLNHGDAVVTSGQFLLDSESRMREAIQKHLDERLLITSASGGAEARAATPSDGQHDHGSVPATTQAAGPRLARSADVDVVFAEYLKLQAVRGAPQPPVGPLNVQPLLGAARGLAEATSGDLKHIPQEVAAAAEALEGKPLEDQRELFKQLSDAVITLADHCPPSKQVAAELYVAYCPMAPGHWLQTAPEIANPYYATEMKRCGEIKRTLPTVTVP